jgi:peptide/nickel transport system ATP-binding protein
MSDSLKPLLQVNNLSLVIGQDGSAITPVHEVNLQLERGETFALLGESGCGKSMTALSIMRLLPPSARITGGEILLDGRDLLSLPEAEMRRERGGRIGMIFQEPMTSLNPVLSIGQQVAEAVSIHDQTQSRGTRQRVVELLNAVGIPDPERRANEYPHQLSGGMKQRVMIAMALAGRPQVLIADEPTTALDVTIQAQVLALLKDIQRDTGMAVLLITHDLGVVAEVADRVAVMYAGEIVEQAGRQAFFDRPCHPYSQALFAALPSTHKRGLSLDVIPGRVPELNQTFSGCRFAPRCNYADERCQMSIPPWRSDAAGDKPSGFRCWFESLDKHSKETDSVTQQSRQSQPAFETLLDVRNLKVHFPIRGGLFRRTLGQVRAVDGVNLTVQQGRTTTLVGESGCGKTTVGKSIVRLINATDGEIVFSGTDLRDLAGKALRQRRADFQIIFQDPASSMNPRMRVLDIVAEGLIAQKQVKGRDQARQQVVTMLQRVGLPESALERYPHEFSGGQRQRIAIARALILQPRLLVCDEPTSALDVSVQAQILNLLAQLQQELGLAYLFITHNLSVVSHLAHDVAVMYLGRIVERGRVDSVLSRPAHPYTQALLSAVPQVEPSSERQVIRLEGDMPSPASPPQGCHFHPRCPRASDICRTSYPAVIEHKDNRRVACHHAAE